MEVGNGIYYSGPRNGNDGKRGYIKGQTARGTTQYLGRGQHAC